MVDVAEDDPPIVLPENSSLLMDELALRQSSLIRHLQPLHETINRPKSPTFVPPLFGAGFSDSALISLGLEEPLPDEDLQNEM